MMGSEIKTAEQIDAAGERLLAWARETGGVLTVAAMLRRDEASGGMAAQPEALFAASLGELSETEIAVMIAQLDVTVLIMLSHMASHAEMGEAAFRRIVNKARKQMLGEEGLDLCDDCGG